MKAKKATTVVAAVALALTLSAAAYAGGGHSYHGHGGVRFGVFVGAPAYWYYPRPYYYPAYPYYYPPVAVTPAAPPVYIERGDAQPAPEAAQDSWYFCPEANAYYPYVKECAKGWQRVAPRPQG